jgi:hypothetical protein
MDNGRQMTRRILTGQLIANGSSSNYSDCLKKEELSNKTIQQLISSTHCKQPS